MGGWFTFVNPAFLWGALAASIPVVVHLINRRRARVLRFPAVQFVLRAERRVARKYRVKQWLLLALRTIILFLLTTALAEPVLQPSEGDLTEITEARAVALILDNTMSMAYQTAGTTAWELAKEAAGLVLQELRPQDQGVVLPVVSTDEAPQALSGERTRLIQQVGALAITYESAGFVEPFQQAYALLKTSDASKKEIVVITDRTRTPWVGFEPAALKVIDPQVQVTLIVVGEKDAPNNVTVGEARLEQTPAVAGVRTKLTASVVNFGNEDRKEVLVRLLVDERTWDQRLLDLPRGAATDVVFDVVFDQPGYRRGAIVLAGDALPVDDTFYFSIPVRKPLRVLLIDGDPRTTLVASETFYLMNALNPERTSRPGPIQPRVVPVEEAEGVHLNDYDVVALANVPVLSSNLRARLLEFTHRGGGLWWFLGQRVDPSIYNRDLFDTSTRLLPARLGTPFDRTGMHPVTLQLPEADHPLLAPFGGRGRGALDGVRVQRLLTTETASLPPTTRVLIALPDGRPLLLEGRVGEGRTLMFTSTADVDWNELPVTTGYLPLIQTGVVYLAGSDSEPRLESDIRIPHAIILPVAESQRDLPITIRDPQGREARLFPEEKVAGAEAHYREARLPGFYHLRLGPETGLVAVNTPLEESDVKFISPEEIREKLPGVPLAIVQWERGEPVRPPQVAPTSLAGWFLVGLLALMLVEGVFANRLH